MINKRMFNLINSVKESKMKKYAIKVLVVITLIVPETLFSETIAMLFDWIIPNVSL